MFCPKCGKQIDDSSVFCEYCGENVEITPADPFQTVYADDSAYENNDYTDNYADNYADDYNNAYPANFTEPQPMPMPSPAPEKSSKKMIAAVCAVCSVMLVLMAVLCAKVIFGGKKIQTDSSSSRPVKAAVIAVAEDSSSVIIAEESSVAETAVTTAATTVATTAPKAESSSQGEKKVKKKALSGIELSDMTIGEIKEYIGDDFEVDYHDFFMTEVSQCGFGITSNEYFKNILVGYNNFSIDPMDYESASDKEAAKRQVYNDFISGAYDYQKPNVMVLDGGLIGYDLNGNKVKAGCSYQGLMLQIESLTGIDEFGDSESIIEAHKVCLHTELMDKRYGSHVYYPADTPLTVTFATIYGNNNSIDLSVFEEGKVAKKAPLMNATYDYEDGLAVRYLYIEKGKKIYIYDNSYNDGWYTVYYKWNTDNGAQWKAGYMRAEYIDWSW